MNNAAINNAPKGKQVSRFTGENSTKKERKKRKPRRYLRRNYAGKSIDFGEASFGVNDSEDKTKNEQTIDLNDFESLIEEENLPSAHTVDSHQEEQMQSSSSYGELIHNVVQNSFQSAEHVETDKEHTQLSFTEEEVNTSNNLDDYNEDHQEVDEEPVHVMEEIQSTQEYQILTGTYSYSTNLLNENEKEYELNELESMLSVQIPFKAWINVKHFIRPPLIPSSVTETYRFIDEEDRANENVRSKFFYTEQTFHETPYCDVASAVISNQIQIENTPSEVHKERLNELYGYSYKKEIKEHHYLGIKTPVLLGQYDIELSMEPIIESPFPVYEVDSIENQLIIHNYNFIPKTPKDQLNTTLLAEEGVIMLEGVVHQSIFCRKDVSINDAYQTISEKLVLHLGVEFMQVQSC